MSDTATVRTNVAMGLQKASSGYRYLPATSNTASRKAINVRSDSTVGTTMSVVKVHSALGASRSGNKIATKDPLHWIGLVALLSIFVGVVLVLFEPNTITGALAPVGLLVFWAVGYFARKRDGFNEGNH
jgi:hypothetical protein